MRKRRLVYTVFYGGNLLAVCLTRAKANEVAKQHVIDLNYRVDRFFITEYQLL